MLKTSSGAPNSALFASAPTPTAVTAMPSRCRVTALALYESSKTGVDLGPEQPPSPTEIRAIARQQADQDAERIVRHSLTPMTAPGAMGHRSSSLLRDRGIGLGVAGGDQILFDILQDRLQQDLARK